MKIVLTLLSILFFIKKIISEKHTSYYAPQLRNETTKKLGIKCTLIQNWSVFDLTKLARPHNVDQDKSFKTQYNTTVFYNFCENTNHHCNDKNSLMQNFDTPNESCNNLAGEAKVVNQWELMNTTNEQSGLRITLNPGDTQPDGQRSVVVWEIECNKTMKEGEIILLNTKDFVPSASHNLIKAISRESCPIVDFYVILAFFDQYKIIFGILLILIGIFECTLGLLLKTITIFIIGCASVFVVTFLFLYSFIIPAGSNPNIVWVVFSISLVLGILLGYFMTRIKILLNIIFGGLLGYMVGTLVYFLALNRVGSNPTLVYYLTIVGGIVLFAIISCLMTLKKCSENSIIYLGTSVVGGYAIIRGISLFAGHFPNESILIDLIKKEEYEEIGRYLVWQTYLYMTGWVFLIVGGIVCQYYIKKSQEPELSNDMKYYQNLGETNITKKK